MASAQLVPASTPFSSEGGWKVGSGERGVCTLLGPEGPGATVAFGLWLWLNPQGFSGFTGFGW